MTIAEESTDHLWDELHRHAETFASKIQSVDSLIAYRLDEVFENYARRGQCEELLAKYSIDEVRSEWLAAAELHLLDRLDALSENTEGNGSL